MNETTITLKDRRNKDVTIKGVEYLGSVYIVVKTRYGNETHWQHTGSSVTACGHWTKTNALNLHQWGASKVTCQKCIDKLGEAF